MFLCLVDGNYGPWYDTSSCTQTCGSFGVKTQERKCDNPLPAHGKDCKDQPSLGARTQTIVCKRGTQCPSKLN